MKNWKKLLLVGVLLSVCLTAGCSAEKGTDKTTLKVVLDYLPNTNHTGLYVALSKGYFAQEDLDIEIIQPGEDTTSMAIVASGKADFGFSYQEDVTFALSQEEPMPIQAIATVMQHNTSGIVVPKDSTIKSPKDFENKTYAGWQSLSEEAVLHALMKQYGADPNRLKIVGSDGSGLKQLQHGIDFIWEFRGWALIKADLEGMDYEFYPLNAWNQDLDYYTPVVISNLQMLNNETETVRKFMRALTKGYTYATQHVEEAAKILHEYIPEYPLEFLKKSQEYVSQEYMKDTTTWGVMKDEVWNNYTKFMLDQGLINTFISADQQATNQYLPN